MATVVPSYVFSTVPVSEVVIVAGVMVTEAGCVVVLPAYSLKRLDRTRHRWNAAIRDVKLRRRQRRLVSVAQVDDAELQAAAARRVAVEEGDLSRRRPVATRHVRREDDRLTICR